MNCNDSMLQHGNRSVVRNIATVYLVLFCIQILPLEGFQVSWLKACTMVLSPIVLLVFSRKISWAMLWGSCSYLWLLFVAMMIHEQYRASTLIFSGMFYVTAMMFYNLIHDEAFSLDYFIKVLEAFIKAYVIIFILQKITISIGITYLPIINLVYYAPPKLNMLAIEASHAARILGVCGYAWLKMMEYKNGQSLSFRQLFTTYRWEVICWLGTMIFGGSGTAFIFLLLIALYFMKLEYVWGVVGIGLIVYFAMPYIDYEPVQRAQATINAVLTMDPDEVMRADSSAAGRVLPILNTLNIDLSILESWLGHGVDTAVESGVWSRTNMVGSITDYGLISYMLSLLFVFTCCIRPFFSLPTLMFFIGIGGGAGNIAYQWGILMIFMCISYFYVQQKSNNNSSTPLASCEKYLQQ